MNNRNALQTMQHAVHDETGLMLPHDMLERLAGMFGGQQGQMDVEVGYDFNDVNMQGEDEAGAWPQRRQPRAFQQQRGGNYPSWFPPGYGTAQRGQGRQCHINPPTAQCGPIGQHLPLPFDSVTTIAAAATANVTTRPQWAFQGSRVIVPSSTVGQYFILNDLKIGTRSQFVANGSLPCVVFAENAIGVQLFMEVASTSMDVTMNVTNIDGNVHRYLAAIIGEACI